MKKAINGLTTSVTAFKSNIKQKIRDKAISRAETRILLAGKKPQDFAADDLEVIVKEEEDKLKQQLREKGLLAIAVILGLGWLN